MSVVRTIRVREDRVQFSAARQINKSWAYGLVVEHVIRIDETAVRFRLGPHGGNFQEPKRKTNRGRQSN